MGTKSFLKDILQITRMTTNISEFNQQKQKVRKWSLNKTIFQPMLEFGFMKPDPTGQWMSEIFDGFNNTNYIKSRMPYLEFSVEKQR